ncbi:MAG TPA: flagellar basal body rod protein FlgC [Chromatiales bacterium]|nr:flagellar basal body rod protein FlgC [Chromatiales bacterium]
MALEKIFGIAGSALSAQSLRLNATASNLANADTVAGAPEQAYKARHPVFATIVSQAMQGAGRSGAGPSAGVAVLGVVEDQAPPRAEYRPGHPLADENGNVYVSNVNLMEEMADLISASRSYQTNVEVMNTSKQLLLKTLELGK